MVITSTTQWASFCLDQGAPCFFPFSSMTSKQVGQLEK